MMQTSFEKLKERLMIARLKSGDLRRWRESYGLTQAQAAEILDLSLTTYHYYEIGYRGYGKPVYIPYSIALACKYYSLIIALRRKNND